MLKLTQIHLSKSILTFFLIFSSLFVASAQEPLQEGYYISLAGDTTFGFIAERGKASNSERIRFFSSKDAEPQNFVPHEINGYGLTGGDRYESYVIPVNKSSLKDAKLTEDPNPEIKMDSIFLNVYVEGFMSLYFFQDDDDNKHFYVKKATGDSMIHLINYRYKEKRYQGTRILTNIKSKKRYINQLAIYMSDCEEIRKDYLAQKYNRLGWKEKEIQDIVLRSVSYTHLRAHETVLDLVCRLLLEKKKH